MLAPHLAFDRGVLVKRHIDAQRFVETVYPTAIPYRLLLVGDQGSVEIRRESSITNPTAVYPTWEYGSQAIEELEEMLAEPVGANVSACGDMRVPADERPVLGQEHRVVVTRYPDGQTNVGKAFLRELALMQREYPDAIVHLHGSYSYRIAFGMGFGSADIDVREAAMSGKIVLGNGKMIRYQEAAKHQAWVHLSSMTLGDLAVPRNRCMFNIDSANWAGKHWAAATRFKTTPTSPMDPYALQADPPTTVSPYTTTIKVQPGDKVVCDTCSLFPTCKYARMGAVCAIPDTDGSKLARHWQTRDSDIILNGVADVMRQMSARFEKGIEDEEFTGELSPEVTKIGKILMQEGGRLAKLVNPALAAAAAPKVQVNIGQVTNEAPNSVAATVIAEIEAKGVARDEITPEMIRAHLNGHLAIETTSREVGAL